ncbi:unnamed protein product, partial [Polarella glacialis]
NRRLVACGSAEAALAICAEHLQEFDCVNLPTALQTVARARGASPDFEDPRFLALISQMQLRTPEPTAQALANATRCFAKADFWSESSSGALGATGTTSISGPTASNPAKI